MKIPRFLYGTRKRVAARCEHIARKLLEGRVWEEAVDESDVAEVSWPYEEPMPTFDDQVMLSPGRIPASTRAYFVNEFGGVVELALRLAWRHAPAERDRIARLAEETFARLLERPWGVAALSARPDSHGWFAELENIRQRRKDRFLPYLEALQGHWEELEGAGRCFTDSDPSLRFHETWGNLMYLLTNAGLPEDELPLRRVGGDITFLGWPPEGIARYVELARERLAQGDAPGQPSPEPNR
ncbi:hypothetical protein [Calidithermus terrae]|nr:hypothetical protein [Calidithermus terrae]